MAEQYIVVFEERSDDGPMYVGPFPSKVAAHDYITDIGHQLDYLEAMAAPLGPPALIDGGDACAK